MLEKSHLPAAVADVDLGDMTERDECEIRRMAEECGRWLKSFGEYRASLVTPSARTVWTALVQGEFDQVSDALRTLKAEIESRADPAAERPDERH